MKLNKKAFTPYLLFIFISATSLVTEAVSINGNFKNAGTSNYVYLYKYFATEITKGDSAKLLNGTFKFKNKLLPRGLYKLGISEEKSFNLVLGDEEIAVSADLEDVNNSVVIQNSKENKIYLQMNDFNAKYNQQFALLDQQAQPLLAIRATEPENFNNGIKLLQFRLDSLNKNRTAFLQKLVSDNPGLLVTKLATPYTVSDSARKESYFTPAELSDPEYTRGDALNTKIVMYLQRFSGQQLPELKQEAATLLSLPATGSKNKEAFYLTLIRLFSPYDPDYTKELTQAYVKEYPTSAFGKKLLKNLPKSAPQVGDEAPEIKLNSPKGQPIALSAYKGKVVLLDFWASWCGPCRRENPTVVKAYQKYKDKGFAIFSVSLDEDKARWIQAIEKDGLVWESHVSDLKGWQSSAAQLYQVKGIPATFLIGKDGKVIGTNLRGESLEEMLAKHCQ